MSFAMTRKVGSGTVVTLGLASLAIALLFFGQVVGWKATWRALGVTPILPSFVDMHIINDYAACAWNGGVDIYAPLSCSIGTLNIPPTWLWVGLLGVNGSDSTWLSAVVITATAVVMVLLFRGRSWSDGLIALAT